MAQDRSSRHWLGDLVASRSDAWVPAVALVPALLIDSDIQIEELDLHWRPALGYIVHCLANLLEQKIFSSFIQIIIMPKKCDITSPRL